VLRGRSIYRVYADPLFSLTCGLILHNTIDFGEYGVVAAKPDVFTGEDPRSPLSYQNTPRRDRLAAKTLDAQSLACAIPPVSGASSCLFVGHVFLLDLR
jgi:hypothetical protein